MDNGDDAFKDVVYQGMDSLLRFTSRAADSLRVASDSAIERLDSTRLERRLSDLYSRLGRLSYELLVKENSVDPAQDDVHALMEELAAVSAALADRHVASSSKGEKNGEK